MARYTDESRERVRDAVDFEEIVGARTELKRAGVARLQGLCPFHDERSPSFGINPTEKVYYCFGCGAGGDVFKFVMETEGLDFGGGAGVAGRALPRAAGARDRGPARRRRARAPRAAVRAARADGGLLRARAVGAAEAAPAREYLASRGLEEGALRAYRVGWAPDAWDRVLNGRAARGYSEEELLAAGLVQRARGGAGLIDRFRGRDHVPAGRRARPRARVRRAGDEARQTSRST